MNTGPIMPDFSYLKGTANSGRPILINTPIEVDWNHREPVDDIQQIQRRAMWETVGLIAAVVALIFLVIL